MNLRKISIATGVAALVLSVNAFAAQPGYFAGLDLGYGKTNYDAGPGISVKTTGFAYGVNGGYNFNNYFGIEGQANRDASVKASLTADPAINATAKFYDVDVLADGYIPVGNNFDLVGKAGFAYAKKSATDVNEHFYRPKLAVGVNYTAMQNLVVGATYSRIFKQGDLTTTKYLPNVDVAAISVDYLF